MIEEQKPVVQVYCCRLLEVYGKISSPSKTQVDYVADALCKNPFFIKDFNKTLSQAILM
jgi:hypothetical protein